MANASAARANSKSGSSAPDRRRASGNKFCYGHRVSGTPSPYVVRDNSEKHRFEIDLGDGSLAVAQYTLREGEIIFTHTEVPSAHEGKGVGSALIRFALGAARSRGLKVIPICPFFAAYMRKHAEEQDLLDPAYR